MQKESTAILATLQVVNVSCGVHLLQIRYVTLSLPS